MVLRVIYLVIAIIGAVIPINNALTLTPENGYLMHSWRVMLNSPELLIPAIALTIWMLAEVYVRKDYWVAPVCIAATFFIGVSCGLPLYLFLRTRPIK